MIVRRLLTILAFVGLLLSLGMGPVAHAMESAACSSAEVAGLHAPDDSDQVPGDAEKGYPHHHGGCHGHHVAAALGTEAVFARANAISLMLPAGMNELVPTAGERDLRPPIA